MAYCTVAEATAAGATGTNDQITAAIAVAKELIDNFTGDLFEETAALAVVGTYLNGQILLPYRLKASPTPTVRFVGETTDVDATSYRFRSSASVGDIDAIEWIGGYGGATRRAVVTGTFGWAVTPKSVNRACALIAAYLTKNPGGSSDTGVKSLSVEGYSVTYGDGGGQGVTTGVPEADMLLRPYRHLVLA